jgi:hypothetical protein
MRRQASLATLAAAAVLLVLTPAKATEALFALDLEGDLGTPFDAFCVYTDDYGLQFRIAYAGSPPRVHEFRAVVATCQIFKRPYYGELRVRLLKSGQVVASTQLPEGPGEATLSSGK